MKKSKLFISFFILFIAFTIFISATEYWEYKLLGDRYFYLKDYAKSIEYYEKALQLNPNYPEVYFKLGQIYKIKGLFDIALFYYNKSIELKNYFQIKESVTLVYYDISEIYFYQKKYSKFLTTLETLLSSDRYYQYINIQYFRIITSIPREYSIYSKAYFRIGYYYFFSGMYEKSINYFLYSYHLKYRESISYWLLSKCFFSIGDQSEYKKTESIAYQTSKELQKFDEKIKWKKIPLQKEYLIAIEKFINEFHGYYYLAD